MPEKKKKTKKNIKVRDLKPRKDAKGGGGYNNHRAIKSVAYTGSSN
jgi:hypothetical protein